MTAVTSFADLSPTPDGLIPAVVQDAGTDAVLMVAYMNEEAWERTMASGYVHFWSRSRRSLWKKGETSGNTLSVVSITADCDADALLVRAQPAGPTCHTGSVSCFGDTSDSLGRSIDTVATTVAARVTERPPGSYTVELVDDVDLAARKVLEEAGEVAFAAKDLVAGGDSSRVVEEAADVVYHLLALLAAVDIDPSDVGLELRRRHTPQRG